MRIPLFWRVLPVYLFIAFLFVLPHVQHAQAVKQTKHVAEAINSRPIAQKSATESFVAGTPTRILIPNVGIDLGIQKGVYYFNSNTWSVSNSLANYADNTALPNNQKDKTLIYGHWTKYVFGPTKDLKEGDIAYVFTAEGPVLKYRYDYNRVIKPTDVGVFEEFKGKPGLVLMTCQGAWAQERRLMFFSLVSVQ